MTATSLQRNNSGLWPAVATLLPIAIGAGALVIYGTRQGIGVSPDSVTYLGVARGLLAQHVIGMGSTNGWFTHVSSYMPGISALYAAIVLLHVPLLTAARVAAAGLMFCNVLTAGWIVYRHSGHSTGRAVIAAALISSSPHVQLVHSYALSEPLFIFLTLVSLGFLAEGSRQGAQLRWFSLTGCALAAAYMTRYAALPVIAALALSVLVVGRASLRERVKSLLALLVAPMVVACIWMLRSRLLGAAAAGRPMAWHGVNEHWFLTGWRTISLWFLPLPISSHLLAGGMVVFVIAGVVLFWLPPRTTLLAPGPLPPLVWLVTLTYAIFLIVTQAAFDPAVQLNLRILSPALVWLIIGCLSARPTWLPAANRCIAAALLVLVCLNCVASGSAAAEARKKGLGYNAPEFKHSQTLAAVRHLPLNRPLYSNAWDIVLFHTDRYAPLIADTNSSQSADVVAVRAMADAMRLHHAVLIELNHAPPRQIVPSLKSLRRQTLIKPLATFDDGALYIYGKGPATTHP